MQKRPGRESPDHRGRRLRCGVMKSLALPVCCSIAALTACGGSSTTDPSHTASSSRPAASTPSLTSPPGRSPGLSHSPGLGGGPSELGPGREICQVQASDGGTYYLNVTSMGANDLSQCDAGTPLRTDTSELLKDPKYGPGVDRRCIYDMTTDPTVNAIVGVYSSSRDADRAAAQAICERHNGSNK